MRCTSYRINAEWIAGARPHPVCAQGPGGRPTPPALKQLKDGLPSETEGKREMEREKEMGGGAKKLRERRGR